MEIKALPIRGMDLSRITGGALFGMRLHPVLKVHRMHDGIDYAAPAGTPIYAVGDGQVAVSKMQDNRRGYGNYIVISHNGHYTLYAHLLARSVRAGQTVKAGQQIGTVGSTGDSTGPHLHFGVCRSFPAANKGWIDPLSLLRAFVAGEQEERDLTKEETLELIKEVLAGKDSKPSAWAEKELQEAKQKGITDGSRPGGYATREEVAAMTIRATK